MGDTHLYFITGEVQSARKKRKEEKDEACVICHKTNDAEHMLLCDSCDEGILFGLVRCFVNIDSFSFNCML